MAELWSDEDEAFFNQTIKAAPRERSVSERFSDSYIDAASRSEVGGAAMVTREYLKRTGKYTEKQIDMALRRIQKQKERKNAEDPAFQGDNWFDKYLSPKNIGKFLVDLGAGTLGGVDPTVVLSPGRTAGGRIISQAGINAGVDAASQAEQKRRFIRDDFDFGQVAMSGLTGVVGQGGGELARKANLGMKINEGRRSRTYSELEPIVLKLEGGGTYANPKTSPKGAMGPMQVMPETARDPGFGIRPWNGKTQEDLARVGKQYLAVMTQKYRGDHAKILAAYNWGPGAVDKAVRKHGDSWLSRAPEETRKYVRNGLAQLGKKEGVEDITAKLDDDPFQALPEEEFNRLRAFDEARYAKDEAEGNLARKLIDDANDDFDPPPGYDDFTNLADKEARFNYAQQFREDGLDFDAVMEKARRGDKLTDDEHAFMNEVGYVQNKANDWVPRDRAYDEGAEMWEEKNFTPLYDPEAQKILRDTPGYRWGGPTIDDPNRVNPASDPIRGFKEPGRTSNMLKWTMPKGRFYEEPRRPDIFNEKDTPSIEGPVRDEPLPRGMHDYTDEEWRKLSIEDKQKAQSVDIEREKKAKGERPPLPSPEAVKLAQEAGYKSLDEVSPEQWAAFEKTAKQSPEYLAARKELADVEEQKKKLWDDFLASGEKVFPKEVEKAYKALGSRQNKLLKLLEKLWKDDAGSYRGDGFDGERIDPNDPEARLMQDVRRLQPKTAEQRRLMHDERARRKGYLNRLQQEGGGRENFYQQKRALQGQLPRSDFRSIAENYTEADFAHLANKINQSTSLLEYEKVSALEALHNLLAVEGSKLPTPGEIKLLAEVYSPDFIQALLDNREFMEKFWQEVGGAINLPRAIMSSMDLSAPFRQGIGFVGKKAFWKNIPDMFKLFGSEQRSRDLMAYIKSHPNWEKAKRGGLAVLDPHSHFLAEREEAFMTASKYFDAEKIPVAGSGVKASNRAYTGFLNKLRFDVFNDLLQKYEAAGMAVDDKKLKEIANFVNTFSGRGDLGKWGNSAAPFLAAGIFSPRLIASRVKMLASPITYAKADPILRKEAWKAALSYSMFVGTVLAIGNEFLGWDVEKDPRSPDFAKMKTGNTRVDVTGGMQPYVRLVAQIVSHSKITGKGDEKDLGGGLNDPAKGPYDENLADVIGRFARTKESPIASLIHNFLAGENIVGEDFKRTRDVGGVKVPEELLERVVPMTIKDLSEVAADSGFTKAVGLAPGALLGAGIQTYKPKEEKTQPVDDDIIAEDFGGEFSSDDFDFGDF